MNLSLTPVWLAVYGRPTVCTSGAREWSYIAVPLRPHACLSLQFGCVTRVRIPQIFMKNALRLVAPLLFSARLPIPAGTSILLASRFCGGRFHEILYQNLVRKGFVRRVYICSSS